MKISFDDDYTLRNIHDELDQLMDEVADSDHFESPTKAKVANKQQVPPMSKLDI